MFFFFNDTATTEIYTLTYTTLFRSDGLQLPRNADRMRCRAARPPRARISALLPEPRTARAFSLRGLRRHHRRATRSEEHTSELQSQSNIVCRLLLEQQKECEVSYSR